MSTSTAQILWSHVQSADLCPGTKSLDEWRNVRWIRIRVGHRMVPILPVLGFRKPLLLHDLHHLVTGYDTSTKGEIEIAAWELASGGCGFSVFFWLLQVGAALLGLFVCPLRTFAAFRRGLRQRNFYRLDPDRLLALDFEELVRKARGAADGSS